MPIVCAVCETRFYFGSFSFRNTGERHNRLTERVLSLVSTKDQSKFIILLYMASNPTITKTVHINKN